MKRRGLLKAIGAALLGGLVAEAEEAQDVKDSIKSLNEAAEMTLTTETYANGETGWLSVNHVRRMERQYRKE